jgi:hypothetical protein
MGRKAGGDYVSRKIDDALFAVRGEVGNYVYLFHVPFFAHKMRRLRAAISLRPYG